MGSWKRGKSFSNLRFLVHCVTQQNYMAWLKLLQARKIQMQSTNVFLSETPWELARLSTLTFVWPSTFGNQVFSFWRHLLLHLQEPALRAPTPIKYNATVIAVQNFKADDDVDTLKQSQGKYLFWSFYYRCCCEFLLIWLGDDICQILSIVFYAILVFLCQRFFMNVIFVLHFL